MNQVSDEAYLQMQNKAWEWANGMIQAQLDDKRPGVSHKENRAIINLKQMIESSTQLFGDKAAFYTKFEKGPYTEISYNRFFEEINALGTVLIKNGLKGKRIAVIGENSYAWSVAYMAIVCGCGVVVPLDKELPYDDLKNLVKESEVSAVFFDDKRRESFEKIFAEGDTGLRLLISQQSKEDSETVKSEWMLIDEGKKLVEDGDRSFIDAQIDYEEMSVLLFTSGTTGMAKGIMLSHKNLCADLMEAPTMLSPQPYDIFFSVLPLHHTFECTCGFLMPLYRGSAIAHCEGLRYISKNIQEIHPTFLLAVPAIFEALHKNIWKNIKKKGKEKTVIKAMKISDTARKFGINLTDKLFGEIKNGLGGSMRMLICGGAAINPQILDDFNSFGIKALQGYGLTEAAPMGALNPDNKPKSASIGLSFPGFELKISNPGTDGIGEICLKGDNIMMGYYNNPEATAEAIRDGWFYTGDLGYIDKEGYVFITGRKKNVIITKNGKNVFPEEIEYQLSLYDAVSESMVFEDESENKDDTLIAAAIYPDWAWIKEKLGEDVSDEDVEKYLWTLVDEMNKNNPPYKMIRKIKLRHSEFIKNTSKKIRRFVAENKQAN